MGRSSSFLVNVLQLLACALLIQGYSERVNFSKLQGLTKPVAVIINRPFKIDCTVDNNQVKITLYKRTRDGKKLEVKADGSKVKRNGDVFTLTIQSYFDPSEFICRGMLHGTAYERTFHAVIIGTEQELSPKPDVFPAYAKPEFGDTVKFTCSADGPLTILSWFKDGVVKSAKAKLSVKNFYEERRRKSVSELTISNINSSDAGTYTCKATTSLSKGYFSYIDATIVFKETKTSYWKTNMDNNLAVVKSGTVTILDCTLSDPNAVVTFYRTSRTGALFPVQTGAGRFGMYSKQQLIIRDIQLKDMGLYICKSSNVHNKLIPLFVTPDRNNICGLFKPSGLRALCTFNPTQFTQYISGLLKQARN